MSGIREVKCGKCNVPLQGPADDPKPKKIFFCPKCGVSDTYENVMREVEEYVTEEAGDYIASGFEKATRGSKYLTFKKGHRMKRAHRFIVEMNLH